MREARILYLDDNLEATDSMAEILTQWHYNVSAVNNPLDALKLLEKNQYHLVISDIRMPEMSGLEFLKKAQPAHLGHADIADDQVILVLFEKLERVEGIVDSRDIVMPLRQDLGHGICCLEVVVKIEDA